MATRSDKVSPTAELARTDEDLSLNGIVNLVRDYAEQETVGPLKGAGRWLGYGAGGAALLGLGLALILLGLLRLIQTEWEWAATGSWSWLSYVIVLVVCLAAIGLSLSRIGKSSLNKEFD